MRIKNILYAALIGLCGCSSTEVIEKGEGTLRVKLQLDPQVVIAVKSADVATFSLEISQDGQVVKKSFSCRR